MRVVAKKTDIHPNKVGHHFRKGRPHVKVKSSAATRISAGLKKITESLKIIFPDTSSFGIRSPKSDLARQLRHLKSLPAGSNVLIMDQGLTVPENHQDLLRGKGHHHWDIGGAWVSRTAKEMGHNTFAITGLPTNLRIPHCMAIECVASFLDGRNLIAAQHVKIIQSLGEDSLYQSIFPSVHKKEPQFIKVTDLIQIEKLKRHCDIGNRKITSVVLTPPVMPELEKRLFGVNVLTKTNEVKLTSMDLVVVQHGGLLRVEEYRNKHMHVEGEIASSDWTSRLTETKKKNESSPNPRRLIVPEPTEADWMRVAKDILDCTKFLKKDGKLLYSIDPVESINQSPYHAISKYLNPSILEKKGLKVKWIEPKSSFDQLVLEATKI